MEDKYDNDTYIESIGKVVLFLVLCVGFVCGVVVAMIFL
jgi:hypothetical protein